MNPTQTQTVSVEQVKAKFVALSPANRTVLAEKLALQVDTVKNNRQLAILSFEDGTDQFTGQIASLNAQIAILDEVINAK